MITQWFNVETFKSLLGSWGLLVTVTLVSVTLWRLPSVWIGDTAVVAFRDQHRGQIGLVAITLGCVFAVKMLFAVAKGTWRLKTSVLAQRSKKVQTAAHRAKVWIRIGRLKQPERELLTACIQDETPMFELSPEDGRVKKLFNIGVISCVDFDSELTVFKIQSWVWQDLETKLSEGAQQSHKC